MNLPNQLRGPVKVWFQSESYRKDVINSTHTSNMYILYMHCMYIYICMIYMYDIYIYIIYVYIYTYLCTHPCFINVILIFSSIRLA